MKDCAKIERLLWDFADDSISSENREIVESHLSECEKCSQAIQTITALGMLSESDKKAIESIDAYKFDDAVLGKIRAQEKLSSIRTAPKANYRFRMALSFGMAIVIVMFLVRSMQDISIPLHKQDIPPSENKEYKIMNFNFADKKPPEKTIAPEIQSESKKPKEPEIKPNETAPAPTIPSLEEENVDLEKRIELLGTQIRPGKNNLAQDYSMVDTIDRYLVEQPKRAPAFQTPHGNADRIMIATPESNLPPQSIAQQYSILASPIASPSPDSTIIGEIYLSNEKLPKNINPISAASISEIISDTAAFETIRGQVHEVITLENMPRAITMVKPDYPHWAQINGISGEVWIKALVDVNGNISDVAILGCSNPGRGFEESAIKAAKESKFTPAEYGGKRFPIWIIYPVKYINKL